MDSSFPLALRHYPRIEGIVPRSTRDITPEASEIHTLGLHLLDELREPLPQEPRLVSSVHGSLEQVLLTVPRYAVQATAGQENPLGAVYRDLLSKLPKGCHFVVLTHESVRNEVRGWLEVASALDRSTVLAMPEHLHFSVWAEDGYVIVHDQNSNKNYFVEPFEFPRYADGLIADFVSNATEYKHTQAPLYFQGGNVLIGDRFFMIGADYPANSLKYMNRVIVPEQGETPASTIKRLYKQYLDHGRDLIYLGATIPVPAETTRKFQMNGETWTETLYFGNKPGTVQPLFHIDMFTTLAGYDREGKYQVVVGDPRLAAQTLGIPVWPHAMAEVFDDIARGLQKRGLVVHRNPLPLAYADDPTARERTWYFATSNNALVEITKDGKRIWVPTYGHGSWSSLKETDAANKKLWESLGFEAIPLGDFHPFAENLGAVHCIKKYLARGAG
jgi:hypothetical protein